MKIRFGGIVFTFSVDVEKTRVTIDRPEECGFSGEGKDMSSAIVNAVRNVFESEVKSKTDFEFCDLAVECLACAYAAGIMKDFEPMAVCTFVYRGAIYSVDVYEGKCVAYRHLETKPISLSAFVLRPEEKLWMAFAQIDAKERAKELVQSYLDMEEYLDE